MIGAAIVLTAASPAFAACPMALAVYSEAGSGASAEFRPSEAMMVTNAFRMLLRNDVVLEGFVMWSDDPARPYGALGHDCPEGDVTGEEIAACTAWEGPVYAVADNGQVSTLPDANEPAPSILIFSNLGASIRQSTAHGAVGTDGLPWDAFTLSGCQE